MGYLDALKVVNYLGLSQSERNGIPQIVVIDKKGVIRAQTEPEGGGKLSDETYLRSLVTSLLNEGAAPKAAAKSK